MNPVRFGEQEKDAGVLPNGLRSAALAGQPGLHYHGGSSGYTR
jgi:hypothetical protein